MIRGFDAKEAEVWFITGSQHLYGQQVLDQVSRHSEQISSRLSGCPLIPVKIVFKPVMTDAESITRLCLEANSSQRCIGLIVWMHTFSPGKMWIAGLKMLNKPFLHLHTQFNRELPWSSIDMDFMNLNQSAHGDREFGFTVSRLRINRKVVVGFWQDEEVASEIGVWIRAAAAWYDARKLKIARFGDNMRNVAVTEGDKIEAALELCYSVNGYSVADLVTHIRQVNDAEVDKLVAAYADEYALAESLRPGGPNRQAILEAARIELGLRHFLEEGNFHCFTDTFEDLHGLTQLPGIAVQRLMADGYGFGAEGDWKTAALVRAMKIMADGLKGGTSFMEDYTYHFKDGGLVLGAHMLEVCPSIAEKKPTVEIHPLAIGGKADPVRLVFTASPGPAVVASVMDFGNRFRLLANRVNVVTPEQPMPKLPVARAFWKPEPSLKVAATAWILAGGSHHTSFSQALTAEHLMDFADMAGLEFLMIDRNTTVPAFKKELRWNAAYYHLANGL